MLEKIFFLSVVLGHEKCTFHHDLELDHRPSTREDLISDMANSYRMLLTSLGENPNRQVNEVEKLIEFVLHNFFSLDLKTFRVC